MQSNFALTFAAGAVALALGTLPATAASALGLAAPAVRAAAGEATVLEPVHWRHRRYYSHSYRPYYYYRPYAYYAPYYSYGYSYYRPRYRYRLW